MTDPEKIPGCVFNNRVHAESGRLKDVIRELSTLSDSFSDTGNDRVADRLYALAETIESVRKSILEAHYQRSQDEYRETTSGVASVLNAILAMPEERAAKLNELIGGK